MRFWSVLLVWVAVLSPLVQYIGTDWLIRHNFFNSGAPLIFIYFVFVAGLVAILRRRCTYPIWVRLLIGIPNALLLAVPPAFAYLNALGRAFKN